MSFLPFAAPEAIRNALPQVGSWQGGRRFSISDLEGFRDRFVERLLQTALYSPELDGAQLAAELLVQAAPVAGVEIIEASGGEAVSSAHALIDVLRAAWHRGERRFEIATSSWLDARDPAALTAIAAAIGEGEGLLELVSDADAHRQLDAQLIGMEGLPGVFFSQIEAGELSSKVAGDRCFAAPVNRAWWRLDPATRAAIRLRLSRLENL